MIGSSTGTFGILGILQKLFSVHLAQISVILSWVSGNCFHLAWGSSYSYWICQPTSTLPIAHSVFGPHYSSLASSGYSSGSLGAFSIVAYSGLYHWMYTCGISSESDLLTLGFLLEPLSIVLLGISLLHIRIGRGGFLSTSYLVNDIILGQSGYRMNYHTGVF